MKTFGIIHQVAGMHLEEASQQHAGGIGEMGAGAALDLREIGLADALAHLLLDGADNLLLGKGAAVAAQRAFHFAQVADFLPELHIANRNINIANCNSDQELDFPPFQTLAVSACGGLPPLWLVPLWERKRRFPSRECCHRTRELI